VRGRSTLLTLTRTLTRTPTLTLTLTLALTRALTLALTLTLTGHEVDEMADLSSSLELNLGELVKTKYDADFYILDQVRVKFRARLGLGLGLLSFLPLFL
jgi:hypothetical protein